MRVDELTALESALDIAVDTLKRRARVLEGQDPDVANALLVVAARLDIGMFLSKALRAKRIQRTLAEVRAEW